MFIKLAASNLATKITYFSMAAAVFVFIAMLFLTQMHP
jgi:hypothetical protein